MATRVVAREELHVNESASLDLLRLLDSIGRWNSHFEDTGAHEPEPEATEAYRVDAQTAGYIAKQLGLYPPFVWECLMHVPVKTAKGIRDWLLSQMDADREGFDALTALYRWAKRRADEYGLEPDEETYHEAREAREALNERYRSTP